MSIKWTVLSSSEIPFYTVLLETFCLEWNDGDWDEHWVETISSLNKKCDVLSIYSIETMRKMWQIQLLFNPSMRDGVRALGIAFFWAIIAMTPLANDYNSCSIPSSDIPWDLSLNTSKDSRGIGVHRKWSLKTIFWIMASMSQPTHISVNSISGE